MINAEIQQTIEIVDAFQLPSPRDQVTFQIPLNGFLEKLDGGKTNATRLNQRIGAFQSFFRKPKSIGRVCFVGFHARRNPFSTMEL